MRAVSQNSKIMTFLILCSVLTVCWAIPAISLVDPDGLELTFISMASSIAIHGPLALVQNEFVFDNPRNKVTEGRFSS